MPVAEMIRHADGRQYVREGSCDGCVRPGLVPGACCTFVRLPLARVLSADEAYWVGLHPGLEVVGDQINIDIPCSALADGRCTLYGTPERPSMCSRYPELPGQLIEGCSYTLTEV